MCLKSWHDWTIDKHTKGSEAWPVPCEHHLGLTEPITTKDFIWLKAFYKHATCSSVKALKIQIIKYKHIYYKRGRLIHSKLCGFCRSGQNIFTCLKKKIDNLYVYFESIIPHVILVRDRKYVYNSRILFYVNLYSIVGRYVG